ncbi:MAG: TfoX/Sxy family DNA transformation protein [Gammaproteobacteria bacterium]
MTKKLEEALQKELKNIGPVMAKKLVNIGVDSPVKLRKIGAKKVFLKLYDKGQFCSKYHAAYLYALEGAIQNCDWRAIPEKLKNEYKEYTKQLRNNHC